uniref:F-box/LRR-repeat protein 14 n=2 Tax=Triticum urartu TaxID=4572 RepID=A0A8R7TYJ8_TRIUA
MAAASASAGNAGEPRLVDRCIDAAARCRASVEAWRRQRRSLERLPGQVADALLSRLAARRLLFPSLLEVFQHSVQEVDFSGNIAVDAEWLAYLGSFRYLGILKLADCKKVDHAAIWPLSGMSMLKELDLSRCSRITDAGIKHIVSIDSLEKLHLSETGLTDNGVMLISALKGLNLLDLGGIHMTDKALRSLQVLTQLEHLDIWGSEITDEGASVLKAFTRLRFLNVSWTHVTRLPPLPNMKYLNMSNCTIYSIRGGDSEVHIPLQKFTASAASFGDIDEVFSSIVASSFSFLDMSGCSLSNLYGLQKMKSLEHLDLSLSRVTDDAIEYVANIGMKLRYLSLKNTGITSQAPCILAGTVPNLASLSLAYTKVDDSALVYISMMPSLRVIDLSHTSIKGFTRAEANSEKVLSLPLLEHLIYLESLNLEDTPLSDEVIPSIASFRALKYLYLKSDFLSDPALHALSSASNLIHLGFCGSILSNSGLLQFVPPAQLHVLDLSGCWVLTGYAISSFRSHHPVIEVRHELIQELQPSHIGTSQVHKSRHLPRAKTKVVNSSADSSRHSGIFFVDQRIKYSREKMLEIQDLTQSNSVLHDVQLPPELRRME